MKRKIIGILTALALAGVGTFLLSAYVRKAEDRALAGEEVVEVLVATEAVDAGTSADSIATRVKTQQVPRKLVASGALTSLDTVEGLVTTIDLLPGDQLARVRFSEPASYQRESDRIVDIPEGYHEVTLPLAVYRAGGGLLRPGDRVSVVASFDPFSLNATVIERPDGTWVNLLETIGLDEGTSSSASTEGEDGAGADSDEPSYSTPSTTHMTISNVLVSNVQGGALTPEGGSGASASGDLLVTLALDAPTAERLLFAAEFGRIWLTSETPGANDDGTIIQTRGTVYLDNSDPARQTEERP